MNENKLIKFIDGIDFINHIKEEKKYFDLNNKTILFIEPYGSTLSLLKHGVSKGFNILIVSAQSDLRVVPDAIHEQAKLSIQIDTANEIELMNLINTLRDVVQIDAVIPGFEYFVPIAAKISQHLQLRGINPSHVMKLRRKDLMRQTLQAAEIEQPKFYLVNAIEDLKLAMEMIGFPAVCKPIDAAGSVHVRKVDNKSQAITAAMRILNNRDVLWGYALSNAMLLEEYVDGEEYSLEGIVYRGNIMYFSLTKKVLSDEREFIEVGHIVDAKVDAGLKEKCETYIDQVINTLGADDGPFHAEIRIKPNGQPVLMEIAARLAGDKIGDLINLSHGINYYDYVFAAYLGDDISPLEMESEHAGIRFFYRPEIEKYSAVYGIDEANKHSISEISIYYKPQENIPSFPKPLRRLGHVIIKHNNYNQLVEMLDDIDELIQFVPVEN